MRSQCTRYPLGSLKRKASIPIGILHCGILSFCRPFPHALFRCSCGFHSSCLFFTFFPVAGVFSLLFSAFHRFLFVFEVDLVSSFLPHIPQLSNPSPSSRFSSSRCSLLTQFLFPPSFFLDTTGFSLTLTPVPFSALCSSLSPSIRLLQPQLFLGI